MNMQSRSQYLLELRREYLCERSKKKRGSLLDEAEKRTGLERKYLIKKLKPKSSLDRIGQRRKKRKVKYDNQFIAVLAQCWKIFDYPCGQRLEPSLKRETDRLRRLGELRCSDEAARKLKQIDSSTIDEKLKHAKEVEHHKQKYSKKIHPLLYEKVPIKMFSEQNRNVPGNIQIDFVEHCGQSAQGEYIYSLSTTDIATGWWEGEPQMGRGQERTFKGIDQARSRYPFPWKEAHPDNDTAFINWHLFNYCQKEGLDFSRSRPYKKNDNCLVEEKNRTHVRRIVGYLRYDTGKELEILIDLYRNELRLYKNFFQPTMKLILKERINGRMHKKYDVPKTPYQRVMEARGVSVEKKKELAAVYESLNPAKLQRTIEQKLNLLYKAHQQKSKSLKVEPNKKQRPVTVSFLIRQPTPVWCHS